MAEVPVSNKDLDNIIYKVTRDVIEEKSINGEVEEVTEDLIRKISEDVILIVERYMFYINEVMSQSALNDAKKINLK